MRTQVELDDQLLRHAAETAERTGRSRDEDIEDLFTELDRVALGSPATSA